jgi:hypothetical protein
VAQAKRKAERKADAPGVSERELRIEPAACDRLVALFGWDDLVRRRRVRRGADDTFDPDDLATACTR